MAMLPSEEINPFSAPAATIGYQNPSGAAGADAELIRRTYLNHEASVRSLGTLSYLGAIFAALGTVGFGIAAVVGVGNAPANGVDPRLLMVGVAGGMALLLVIYGGIGYGLRNLQPWARWVNLVLTGLSLVVNAAQVVITAAVSPAAALPVLIGAIIGSLIPGYIFYLMASAKGAMVFSREYREIVKATPYIKYKTSLLVKIILGLFIAMVVLAVVAAIFGGRR